MKIGEKWLPIIDFERCSGCGACVNFCAAGCLGMAADRAVVENARNCKSDRRCVRICSRGAIEMGWVALDGDRSRGQWRTVTAVTAFHTVLS
jgi:NAD-dependent dihydropyrimidine dehydrogenase PreA subunit